VLPALWVRLELAQQELLVLPVQMAQPGQMALQELQELQELA